MAHCHIAAATNQPGLTLVLAVMRRFLATLGALIAASVLAASRPNIQTVKADLDGDGRPETAVLTQRAKSITLTVHGPTLGNSGQTLSFGIDASRQDAVCATPVVLEVTQQDCKPEALGGEQLEGCKINKRSKDLVISDGECDPIYLYWNHQKNAVWWWRL